MTSVERLVPGQWAEWKALRLEGLLRHPEAFGGDWESESRQTPAEWQAGMTGRSHVFAARLEGGLVGSAGFAPFAPAKERHRGILFAMYVRDGHRGSGIADRLIEAAFAAAQPLVVQIHCAARVGNEPAIRLYRRHGFEIYGTEPRSLLVDGVYHDEHLMVRRFR
ncbi:GNAT family N-acetyltransferase [Oceanibaculum pacificum]|uniref:N-acetyltransferase domain-containing protein n=1 Tax=Oceanibaculum pacificum TaxID=580166 RepID=A0A154W2V7_9PROT|nr:GNAT family N-acetyltransferase [Oceanibaculum pacificum]KZD07860.1 hypothetical protein AUP43_09565 [Oceanibaculum pacificum]